MFPTLDRRWRQHGRFWRLQHLLDKCVTFQICPAVRNDFLFHFLDWHSTYVTDTLCQPWITALSIEFLLSGSWILRAPMKGFFALELGSVDPFPSAAVWKWKVISRYQEIIWPADVGFNLRMLVFSLSLAFDWGQEGVISRYQDFPHGGWWERINTSELQRKESFHRSS